MEVHKIYNSKNNNNNSKKTQGGPHDSELQKERMGTKPPLRVFKPLELHIPTSRLGYAKGQPFEFGLGSRIVQELGSSKKGLKNVTT
jgi:hypothetical protein